MSAGTSELFCLICFLVCSCTAQTNFTAELGQDLTLLWTISENITAVECRRPEMKAKYVLSYRDGRLDPEKQHPSYKNRVDLQDKEMKDGKFTLILKNVKMEDTGTYECHVFHKKTCSWIRSIWERSSWRIESIISIFNLEVVEPVDKDGGDKDGGDMDGGDKVGNIIRSVLAVILVALTSVGLLICRSLDDP